MLESQVENRLKKLKNYGFEVHKFKMPGTSGGMDRLILWPKYAPKGISLVEIKRPGEAPRKQQEALAEMWRKRGVDVREPCSNYAEIDALIEALVTEAEYAKHVAA